MRQSRSCRVDRERTCFVAIRKAAWIVAIGLGAFAGTVHAGDDGVTVPDLDLHGGLIVVLDTPDAAGLVTLQSQGAFLVHGLVRDGQQIDRMRSKLAAAGRSGAITVDLWDGTHIPFVANTVNVIVSRAEPVTDEVKRVLAPYGRVLSSGGTERWRKPWPEAMDEWTHYLHGPDNNAVAQDSLVGPPRCLRWLGAPMKTRHHDHLTSITAMVASRGRLFYIFDEAPDASILYPPDWRLIARDAFNGVVLWKRPITEWWPHLTPLKSLPVNLPRRLVAVKEDVYVALGVHAPISHLNARDGTTVKTFKGSERCEEIVVSGTTLLVVRLTGRGPLDDSDKDGNFAIGRAKPFTLTRKLASAIGSPLWLSAERRLLAYDVKTGEERWQTEGSIAPLTMATDGERIYFNDKKAIVALDFRTGRQLWRSVEVPIWQQHQGWFGASLVAWKDVVLWAGGENMTGPYGSKGSMMAFSAKDGTKLWTADHPPSGHRCPEDLMIAQGLVWAADIAKNASSTLLGLHPLTGETRRRVAIETGQGFHQRCHRNKATESHLIVGKIGINLIGLNNEGVSNNQWIRGACGYGIMPANGMLYVPPNPCICSPESLVRGFAAVAAEGAGSERISVLPKLWKALPPINIAPESASSQGSWPTYRHDAGRSGVADTALPTDLQPLWQNSVGKLLSAPVVADGRVYVASIDRHEVIALAADSGKVQWRYVAGGRVDSPPTVVGNGVYFGSADGSVVCLRADDGRLVWRHRVAPGEERLVSCGRLESVWPVHGSVLFHDGAVHAVAGRSQFLDGGLNLVSLGPLSGEALATRTLHRQGPGGGLRDRPASTDILSAQGDTVFMLSQAMPIAGKSKGGATPHLFSPFGFLDGSWFHRAFWIFGTGYSGGHNGFGVTGNSNIAGRLLVHDDRTIYGFGRQAYGWGSVYDYRVHRTDLGNAPRASAAKPRKKGKKRGRSSKPKPIWSVDVPVLARGMLKSGDHLFIAGPKELYTEPAIAERLEEADIQARVKQQKESLNGPATLVVLSTRDGALVRQIELSCGVRWDGLAAAGERLYLSGLDGRVHCLGNAR